MISIRSILLILFIWFILWFGRRLFIKAKQNKEYKKMMGQKTAATPQQSKAMVRCEYCGVYLPKEEALNSGNNRYYCEEHRAKRNA